MVKSIKKFFKDNALNDSWFRIAFFVSVFFSGIIFLDIVSVFAIATIMLWSIFILQNKIKNNSLNVKYKNLISLFLIFSIITAFLHIHVGFPINFIANLVMIYYACICFFIFYSMYTYNDHIKIKQEAILLLKIIVVLTVLFNVISFISLLFTHSFTFTLDMPIIENYYEKYQRTFGLMKSENAERFTGVYINPNILAFYSVVSIIFCHILYRSSEFLKSKKRYLRILAFIMLIAIDLAALILSDSIASFLFLLLYILLWLFYKLMIDKNTFSLKVLLKKGIVFFVVCLTIIFGLFAIRSSFQEGASSFVDEIYSVIDKTNAVEDIDEDIHFGRLNHDIRNGSGRRRLLKQAMVMFTKHPLLGVGNANVVDYGKIYFENGIAFTNFHNGYVSILVCNGLIGFVIFIIFLILVLLKLIKFLFYKASHLENNIFANLIIAILSYMFFSLFEKTMLSEINYMTLFFWLILGYAVSFANSYGDFN